MKSIFSRPITGRYLCLQALSSIDGKSVASIAELDASDPSGQVIPRTNWKVVWVDSEEQGREAEDALDGQASSQWDSAHAGSAYPHEIIIDLGQSLSVGGIRYLFSSDTKYPGQIKDYRVYIDDHPFGLILPP